MSVPITMNRDIKDPNDLNVRIGYISAVLLPKNCVLKKTDVLDDVLTARNIINPRLKKGQTALYIKGVEIADEFRGKGIGVRAVVDLLQDSTVQYDRVFLWACPIIQEGTQEMRIRGSAKLWRFWQEKLDFRQLGDTVFLGRVGRYPFPPSTKPVSPYTIPKNWIMSFGEEKCLKFVEEGLLLPPGWEPRDAKKRKRVYDEMITDIVLTNMMEAFGLVLSDDEGEDGED